MKQRKSENVSRALNTVKLRIVSPQLMRGGPEILANIDYLFYLSDKEINMFGNCLAAYDNSDYQI